MPALASNSEKSTLKLAVWIVLAAVLLLGLLAAWVPAAIQSVPQEGVRFDWTISLGTIIHLVSLVAAITLMYAKLVQRIVRVERRVGRVYVWLKAIIHQVPGIDPQLLLAAEDDED